MGLDLHGWYNIDDEKREDKDKDKDEDDDEDEDDDDDDDEDDDDDDDEDEDDDDDDDEDDEDDDDEDDDDDDDDDDVVVVVVANDIWASSKFLNESSVAKTPLDRSTAGATYSTSTHTHTHTLFFRWSKRRTQRSIGQSLQTTSRTQQINCKGGNTTKWQFLWLELCDNSSSKRVSKSNKSLSQLLIAQFLGTCAAFKSPQMQWCTINLNQFAKEQQRLAKTFGRQREWFRPLSLHAIAMP